jgi:hypothetical protein
LIILVVAIDDIRKALTSEFGERLDRSEMTAMQRFSARFAGTWGFAARAIVLLFASGFVLRAALFSNPNDVKGLQGILASLLALPNGRWLLGMIGMGLGAYGCFMVFAGRYRHHPS